MVTTGRNFWAGRSVLITGNTGFKGTWLSFWLTYMGAKVSGMSLPPDQDPGHTALSITNDQVKTHFIDIRGPEPVSACIAAVRPSVVFHMAAQALVRPSYQDPVGTYATNVMGTVHVLEAIRQHGGVEAVVVVTSDKCYENREWPWGYREDEAMGGYDPYSSSKGCAELVASAYRRSFFTGPDKTLCRVASARAGNVIGGGDWSVDRLVPDMVRSMSDGTSIEIRSPDAVRPWQHVLEPLSGYVRLAQTLVSPQGDRYAEAWNFGPAEDDCRPVSYLVEKVTQAWGEGARWHLSEKVQPHEAHFLKVDSSKSRARLNWNRRMSLERTLEWTVEWYRRQRAGEKPQSLTLEQIDRYEQLAGVQR
ncbi:MULTISPECIES: CDP-glucose 4,6-dehydratase [unclassified Bradyrhizobium]|uniref:CDP-glucose 4,6-dehydratase n=1 Tax=unclassified Bradyrhizobium TaxID=2631580 RepID=UPI001FF7D018|nr:CDP-glucose 4,6-dehydratase [Bradyrhizobium sp. 156]MCK1635250.1 CDP-glucose 4,6-dehydratase [Bradyrhizobium sp. 162]